MATQGNSKLRDRLIGTWRLVSAMREEIPSGAKTPFLGENPTGFLHYMPEGRMLALITRAGRKAPVGKVANAAEAEALIRSMISYGGTYECGDDEVIHHCDISWNQSFTGTVQRRSVTFEGDRMTLSPPPSPDPTDGTMSVRRLTWERVP
jgi:Lipocalin-like domain